MHRTNNASRFELPVTAGCFSFLLAAGSPEKKGRLFQSPDSPMVIPGLVSSAKYLLKWLSADLLNDARFSRSLARLLQPSFRLVCMLGQEVWQAILREHMKIFSSSSLTERYSSFLVHNKRACLSYAMEDSC
jgi:hypothetical protein